MNALAKIIKRKIEKTGPISISSFMEICLYHPKFGYYTTKNPIGKEGDFITSPEISQVFGELIGVWLVNTWKVIGKPKSFNLVELGPGKGTLIKDIWRSTKIWPEFQKAANLCLFEKSNILTAIQKNTLREIPVTWLNRLVSIKRQPTLCIANEFFDALPVKQFMQKNRVLFEKKISLSKNNEMQFELFKSDREYNCFAKKYDPEEDVVIERSEVQIQILKCICKKMEGLPGCLLIIDYGDEHGKVDTLQGMYRNKYCNFLEKPGQVDLTSHVDFALLSDYSKFFGAAPSKLITQRVFLTKMGIFERFKQLDKSLTEAHKNSQAKILNRLVSEKQMGNLVKVLAVKSNVGPSIYPFSF